MPKASPKNQTFMESIHAKKVAVEQALIEHMDEKIKINNRRPWIVNRLAGSYYTPQTKARELAKLGIDPKHLGHGGNSAAYHDRTPSEGFRGEWLFPKGISEKEQALRNARKDLNDTMNNEQKTLSRYRKTPNALRGVTRVGAGLVSGIAAAGAATAIYPVTFVVGGLGRRLPLVGPAIGALADGLNRVPAYLGGKSSELLGRGGRDLGSAIKRSPLARAVTEEPDFSFRGKGSYKANGQTVKRNALGDSYDALVKEQDVATATAAAATAASSTTQSKSGADRSVRVDPPSPTTTASTPASTAAGVRVGPPGEVNSPTVHSSPVGLAQIVNKYNNAAIMDAASGTYRPGYKEAVQKGEGIELTFPDTSSKTAFFKDLASSMDFEAVQGGKMIAFAVGGQLHQEGEPNYDAELAKYQQEKVDKARIAAADLGGNAVHPSSAGPHLNRHSDAFVPGRNPPPAIEDASPNSSNKIPEIDPASARRALELSDALKSRRVPPPPPLPDSQQPKPGKKGKLAIEDAASNSSTAAKDKKPVKDFLDELQTMRKKILEKKDKGEEKPGASSDAVHDTSNRL